jgi:hypothetical protein
MKQMKRVVLAGCLVVSLGCCVSFAFAGGEKTNENVKMEVKGYKEKPEMAVIPGEQHDTGRALDYKEEAQMAVIPGEMPED